MAQNSMPPAPQGGGGGGKYLVILLLLVAGGVGVFLAMPKKEPPAKVETPPAPPPKVERSTSLVDETMEIPEPEKDAGAPKPVETPKPKRTGGGGDSWACQGDIPAKEIKKVLGDSQTQIRSCYERALRNNNMLQGNVNLQVKIGVGGKVVATRTRGSLKDNGVYTCMENIAKNWTFPVPEGGPCAVFDAPYNFTPKR